MEYVIFDLATVRYRFAPANAYVQAVASSGELLAVAELSPEVSSRQAAFLALDAALRSGRVSRGSQRYRVAFYNPYTADVCIDPVPTTQVFSDQAPLAFDAQGCIARLTPEGLCTDARVLGPVTPSLPRTSRAVLAHQLNV